MDGWLVGWLGCLVVGSTLRCGVMRCFRFEEGVVTRFIRSVLLLVDRHPVSSFDVFLLFLYNYSFGCVIERKGGGDDDECVWGIGMKFAIRVGEG